MACFKVNINEEWYDIRDYQEEAIMLLIACGQSYYHYNKNGYVFTIKWYNDNIMQIIRDDNTTMDIKLQINCPKCNNDSPIKMKYEKNLCSICECSCNVNYYICCCNLLYSCNTCISNILLNDFKHTEATKNALYAFPIPLPPDIIIRMNDI